MDIGRTHYHGQSDRGCQTGTHYHAARVAYAIGQITREEWHLFLATEPEALRDFYVLREWEASARRVFVAAERILKNLR